MAGSYELEVPGKMATALFRNIGGGSIPLAVVWKKKQLEVSVGKNKTVLEAAPTR